MGRDTMAGYAALVVALGLGLLGDQWVRGGRAGVAVPLYALLLVGALVGVAALSGRRATRRNLWCLPALAALALLPWLRDAPALTFASLCACFGLLLLLAHGYAGAPLDRLGPLQYLGAAVATSWAAWTRPAAPVGRLAGLVGQRVPARGAAPLLRGLVLAVPVLVTFTALLASADVVFGMYVERATRLDLGVDLGQLPGHALVALLIAWPLAGGLLHAIRVAPDRARLAHGAAAPADEPSAAVALWLATLAASGTPVTAKQAALPTPATMKQFQPAASVAASPATSAAPATDAAPRASAAGPRIGFLEAAMVLAAVDLLFLAFVGVQFAYLFGGRETLDVAGLTYAEYARRGFFELLAVAALALPLVVVLDGIAVRDTRGRRRAFQALAAVLVLCNLVILGSAMQRLLLYEDAYGWTTPRLHSHSFMVWLAALCLLLLGALLAERRRWLAFGTLASALVALVGFGLLDPDRFIAEQNLARYTAGRPLDAAHFTALGADAAPVVLRAFDLAAARGDAAIRDALGAGLHRRLADLDCAAEAPWFTHNLARDAAHTALAARRDELAAYPYRARRAACTPTTPPATVQTALPAAAS